MTKAAKKPDSRAKALAAMTKTELIRTIKALDRRQTQLLNELAAEKKLAGALVRDSAEPLILDPQKHVTPAPPAFPWGDSNG